MQHCANLQAHISDQNAFMMTCYSALQADREQLTQLAFEEFNMTGFFLCDQPVCSLYAVGKITGTVIDLGYAKTGRCHYHCVACRQQHSMHATLSPDLRHAHCCPVIMCVRPALLHAWLNAATWSKTLLLADVSVVAEGQVNYHNTKRLPYGGRDLDALLVSLLQQRAIECSDPQKLKELCARTPSVPSADPEVCENRPKR